MKFNKYKCFKWRYCKGANLVGPYDMPELSPVHDVEIDEVTPFHLIGNDDLQSTKSFHFYVDDYRYESFWKNAKLYLPRLRRCKNGIGPDFSMLLDMPVPQQIYNNWRNKALTFYLQSQGLLTVPNVGWSDESSFEWAFDGIPSNSVLAVTSQGCMGRDYICKHSFLSGMHELVRRKHPSKIYVYGIFPEQWKERFSVPIVTLKTYSFERFGGKCG